VKTLYSMRFYIEKKNKYKITFLFIDFLNQHESCQLVQILASYKSFISFMHKTVAFTIVYCIVKHCRTIKTEFNCLINKWHSSENLSPYVPEISVK